MIVNAKVKSICQIDINEAEAFRILCKTINMEFVLDEVAEMFVKKRRTWK